MLSKEMFDIKSKKSDKNYLFFSGFLENLNIFF